MALAAAWRTSSSCRCVLTGLRGPHLALRATSFLIRSFSFSMEYAPPIVAMHSSHSRVSICSARARTYVDADRGWTSLPRRITVEK